MAKNPTKCKFDYLRNWLDNGYTVNLECQSSRSGMSMSVYCRDERIFTVQGCGFDRIGTAIGDFLEPLFQAELRATMEADPAREYACKGWYGCKLYGACIRPDGSISLEGGCGERSMQAIAQAIGLKVETSSLRNSTLITFSKA